MVAVGRLVYLCLWQYGRHEVVIVRGCCRQVSTVVSRVVWYIGGCYCKVVSLGRYI